ncbi:hypothetical protein [Mycolicibacterium sp. XJ870]
MTIWAFGFAAYMVYATSGAAKPRKEWGAAGTLLRPQRCVDAVFVASTTAVFLAAALYLAFSQFGMVDYVPSGVMRGLVPAACGALALFGAPTLYRMFKHRGGSHLRLDPRGFEVWEGQWNSFVRGTWDEVEQILDHPTRGGKPFHEVIVFALPQGRSVKLVSDTITGNSHALREWVRFYWQHPECRGELTDERALRRLDEEKFTTE